MEQMQRIHNTGNTIDHLCGFLDGYTLKKGLAANSQARNKRRDANGDKDRGGGKAALQLRNNHSRR